MTSPESSKKNTPTMDWRGALLKDGGKPFRFTSKKSQDIAKEKAMEIEKEKAKLKENILHLAQFCEKEESVKFLENPGWVETIEELRKLDKEMWQIQVEYERQHANRRRRYDYELRQAAREYDEYDEYEAAASQLYKTIFGEKQYKEVYGSVE